MKETIKVSVHRRSSFTAACELELAQVDRELSELESLKPEVFLSSETWEGTDSMGGDVSEEVQPYVAAHHALMRARTRLVRYGVSSDERRALEELQQRASVYGAEPF